MRAHPTRTTRRRTDAHQDHRLDTDDIDNPHEIHWRAGHAQKRLGRTASSQKLHDRRYRKQIKVAQRKQAKADRLAQRAEELRAAGRGKRAARVERRARLARESADRIRAKAEQRWREDTTRTGRKRTALKWALAATLAAAATVAAGWTAMAPTVYGNELVEPTVDEFEPGEPPHVEGDPPRPEADPDEAQAGVADGEEQAAEEQAAEAEGNPADQTGAIVQAYYTGNGQNFADNGLRGGVAFTITSLDNGSEVSGTTINSEPGALYSLKPGSYRVTLDASGFNTLVCDGGYTRDFHLAKGRQAVLTAYVLDQGGSTFVPPECIALKYQSAE